MLKDILRIFVTLIFLLSGFVKAVDLVGFSFKMEEYFSPAVFNLTVLEPYALIFSLIVVLSELILGLLLLLGIKIRGAILWLIGLCIFFGFLTFYSAYYNVVTDCGCFGDAIKFTPWESFAKDMVLLLALLILYFLYSKKESYFSSQNERKKLPVWKAVFAAVFSGLLIFVMAKGILYEPVIDFRDYKKGTDLLAEKKKIAAHPPVYKTFYTLRNSKTAAEITVNQDDFVNEKQYWQEGTPWKILEGKNTTQLVKEGYTSEIAKLKMEDAGGNDLTARILNTPRAVLVFSYQPKEADAQLLSNIENKLLNEKNTYTAGISTDISTFKRIPNLMMDGTAIKTIARSNPFVLVLEKGKIVDKIPGKVYAQ